MRRKHTRLVLHRETLLRLDPALLGPVAGAVIPPVESGFTDCVSRCASNCCPNEGGGGSFGTCYNTCGVCSGGCATGGACTT